MRYPGGKGKTYQRLINLMPPHRVYIESHLGGGAVMRHKRPAEANIGLDLDAEVVAKWNQDDSLACTVLQANAIDYLRQHPIAGDTLIYADPPYLPETRLRSRVYRQDCSAGDHWQLLTVLKRLDCMVMVSGYQSDLYDHALAGWRKTTFQAMSHVGLRTEVVWMNFPEPKVLHDASFLGVSFRERQSIKRRHERLVGRFAEMVPAERSHLLELLNVRFGTAPGATS